MKTAVVCATLFTLTACGGGGGGGGDLMITPTAPNSTVYEKLDQLSQSTATLQAVVTQNATTLINDAVAYDADTQSVTLRGATVAVGTNSDLTVLNGLDYVGRVTAAMGQDTYTGFVGVKTATTDMPSTQTVTLAGQAQATIKLPATGGNQDLTGTSTVKLTLGDINRVDVDMMFAGDGTIDKIQYHNATLSGSGFSGGTLTTSKNGTAVAILRDSDRVVGQGQFFGPQAANVAGQVLATSGTGDNSVNAQFYGVKQ